ncbi:MAG: GAF domain-containing protein [Deltaproteobacteria bacterium]|nr:GAF domain-containing protein [Deltaproteobacteria bacterium]MBW2362139.1 GAF domain-containing protein [Deltaproteobacteria bacterium]
MRRRIAIYGATEEALQLVPLLLANPGIEIAGVYDTDPAALRDRLATLDPEIATALRGRVHTDAAALAADPDLFAVIDAEPAAGFAEAFPEAAARGVQVVSTLVARLLWCFGGGDRKAELLQALHEIVESYNLTVDPEDLFRRMLEIAIGVTDADGGSLMLLDPERRELRVRMAVGLERELWDKIRVPVGEGIAGRVVEEARALRLRGKADRQAFHIVRERLDVESALCVPLVHGGEILGVLNLHHSSRADAFSEADLEFTEQLAQLDAQIIARAQEHESMRTQAVRYAAVREVREALSARTPLPERLAQLCRIVVGRAGSGIANLYLYDPDEEDLYLAASSLEGSIHGEEVRVALGQGIDGQVAATREPAFLRTEAGLAYAALPLLAGDALAGVLALQAGADTPQGGGAEEVLSEIATAAAEEITSLRRQARVHARATKIGAINEAGIRMMSADDPAEVLRQGSSSAAMVLQADHALLRLRDEETGRYAIRSYFGSADGAFQERLFKLDKRASMVVLKRRSPLLVRHVAKDADLSEFGDEVCSVLAAPIRRDGAVVGTLALYDKMSSERFTAGPFSDEDLELFAKFVTHLERAISNAQFIWRARQFRNFDEHTGLPNRAYLDRRLREELVRAAGRPGELALASCRIENLDEIARTRGAAFARRVLKKTSDALRRHLRDFDVPGRSGDTEFAVLLPVPGPAPDERVSELARNVAEEISRDEALNDPIRVALAFGHACYPEEGDDAETLLERAREPRIRMI